MLLKTSVFLFQSFGRLGNKSFRIISSFSIISLCCNLPSPYKAFLNALGSVTLSSCMDLLSNPIPVTPVILLILEKISTTTPTPVAMLQKSSTCWKHLWICNLSLSPIYRAVIELSL